MMRVNWRYMLIALMVIGTDLTRNTSAVSAQQPTGAAQMTPATLAEVRQLASDWKNSFKSLKLTCERRLLPITSPRLVDWSPSADQLSSPMLATGQWIWSHERLDRFEEIRFAEGSSEPTHRRIEVYDGRNESYFTAEYDFDVSPSPGIQQGHVARLKRLSFSRVIESAPPVSFAWDTLPWIYRRSDRQWFNELISVVPPSDSPVRPPVAPEQNTGTNGWQLDDFETLSGSRCAKLRRVTLAGGEPEQRTEETIWLDLDHGALPRRVLKQFFDGTQTSASQQEFRQEFVVDEFQHVAGRVWFPKVSRLRTGSEMLLLLTIADVQLDIEIRDEDFEPPEPEADTIVEHSQGLIMTTLSDSGDSPQSSNRIPQQQSELASSDSASGGESSFWTTSSGLLLLMLTLMASGLLAGFLIIRRRR